MSSFNCDNSIQFCYGINKNQFDPDIIDPSVPMARAFFCKVLNDTKGLPSKVGDKNSKNIICPNFNLLDLLPTLRTFYSYNNQAPGSCNNPALINTIVFDTKLLVNQNFIDNYQRNIMTIPSQNINKNSIIAMVPNNLPTINQKIYFYRQSRDELEDAYSEYLSDNSLEWKCVLQKKSNVKDIDIDKNDNSDENKEVKENFEGKSNDSDEDKINESFENISKKSVINLLYIFIPYLFSIIYIMIKLGVNNTWYIWFPFNLIMNKSKMVKSILFFLLVSFVLFLVVSYFLFHNYFFYKSRF